MYRLKYVFFRLYNLEVRVHATFSSYLKTNTFGRKSLLMHLKILNI